MNTAPGLCKGYRFPEVSAQGNSIPPYGVLGLRWHNHSQEAWLSISLTQVQLDLEHHAEECRGPRACSSSAMEELQGCSPAVSAARG